MWNISAFTDTAVYNWFMQKNSNNYKKRADRAMFLLPFTTDVQNQTGS